MSERDREADSNYGQTVSVSVRRLEESGWWGSFRYEVSVTLQMAGRVPITSTATANDSLSAFRDAMRGAKDMVSETVDFWGEPSIQAYLDGWKGWDSPL